jgi:hypothetical protein
MLNCATYFFLSCDFPRCRAQHLAHANWCFPHDPPNANTVLSPLPKGWTRRRHETLEIEEFLCPDHSTYFCPTCNKKVDDGS